MVRHKDILRCRSSAIQTSKSILCSFLDRRNAWASRSLVHRELEPRYSRYPIDKRETLTQASTHGRWSCHCSKPISSQRGNRDDRRVPESRFLLCCHM